MKKLLSKIFVVMLYFVIPYYTIIILNTFKIDEKIGLVIQMIVNFILLFTVIKVLKKTLKKEYSIFKRNKFKYLKQGLGIFVIGLLLYYVATFVIHMLFPILFDIDQNYNIMLSNFKKVPILLVINTIFYYPVIEELVFKSIFKDTIKNKWTFVIITGLLIAFFQTIFSSTNYISYLLLIPRLIIGMTFSYMYYKTKNVFTPIIYRMAYNLLLNIANLIILFQVISRVI